MPDAGKLSEVVECGTAVLSSSPIASHRKVPKQGGGCLRYSRLKLVGRKGVGSGQDEEMAPGAALAVCPCRPQTPQYGRDAYNNPPSVARFSATIITVRTGPRASGDSGQFSETNLLQKRLI